MITAASSDIIPFVRKSASQFFTWWSNELVGLLPTRVRDHIRTKHLVVMPEGNRIALYVRSGLLTKTILDASDPAAFDHIREKIRDLSTNHDVVVSVPTDKYLLKDVVLPAAARAHLDEALRHQISRISPFRDSDVHYCFCMVPEKSNDAQLTARVAIITKQDLEHLQEEIQEIGVRCDQFEFLTSPDPSSLALILKLGPQPFLTRTRTFDLALIALGLSLAVAGVTLAYLASARHNEQLTHEIAQVRPLAEKVATLSRLTDTTRELASFVITEKSKAVHQLQILDRLTEILADDVRLSEYRANGNTIIISGYAPDATRLLATIDTNPQFRSAKFTAPTARDQATDLDRFSLSFEIEKAP